MAQQVKNPSAMQDTGDTSSIPGSGRSPGAGNGSPLQYSCLKNPMDRGAWQATVHRGRGRAGEGGSQESETTERLSI